MDKVKELLGTGEWDFSAEFYGHTWIERAMAIRPKFVEGVHRIGEFQQAKEEILCAIFEAAFRSEIRPESGLMRDQGGGQWRESTPSTDR